MFANKAEYAAELIKMGYDGSFPAILTDEEKDIIAKKMNCTFDKKDKICGYKCPISEKNARLGF